MPRILQEAAIDLLWRWVLKHPHDPHCQARGRGHMLGGFPLPAFFAAWPMALWLGGEERLLFTFAVFAGCWLAWGLKSMGAADGKLATIIAAVSPMALGVGVLLLVVGFVGMRLWQGRSASLPAAVGFYGGAVAMALAGFSPVLWT